MPLYLGQEDAGTSDFTLQDFEPSWASKMNASVREAWLESYGPVALDYAIPKIAQFLGDDTSAKLSAAEAGDKIKQSGVKWTKPLADGQYTRTQLDIMLERQRELQAVKDIRERTPWDLSSPLRGAAMFGAGIADPINLATAFVPWTKLIPAAAGLRAATVGGSFVARTGARAAVGALDGGISTAALEPFYSFARDGLGDDYDALDSLANIAFGTAFGGGIHAIGGAGTDAFRALRSRRAVTSTPESSSARAGMPDVVEPAPAAFDGIPVREGQAAGATPGRAPELTSRVFEEPGAVLVAEAAGARATGTMVDGRLRLDLDAIPPEMVEDGTAAALVERLVDEATERGFEINAEVFGGTESAALLQALEKRGFAIRREDDASAVVGVQGPSSSQISGGFPDRASLVIWRAPGQTKPAPTAARTISQVEPETREAALRSAVSQAASGREIDVDAIVGLDPAVGSATRSDALRAIEQNFSAEAQPLADFRASAVTQARNDLNAKWQLDDALSAAVEAETVLDDMVRAGDQAFMFSRGQAAEGSPSGPAPLDVLADSLRAAFGSSTAAMLARGQIQVVATPADIPGGPHPGDVKAATVPDGRVYVVAENVSPAEARGILLHEVGVHVGMRDMLGPEVFDSVLADLDAAIIGGEVWAQAARAAVPADTPAGLVREEQLAYLVENSPELPIVQRIIAAIRAWAYRNFEFARDAIELTEADFRAMAVSALHHVARGERMAPSASYLYARGDSQQRGAEIEGEMAPYRTQEERAKAYAAALRAAADKLGRDAEAVAQMRAAMPDITEQEMRDLLVGLRHEVAGLRKVTRQVRAGIKGQETADITQAEAMQAADTLANNIEMAAVIERRNAALNAAARLRATSYLNQFRESKLDFEGFRGLLVGTERKRAGGRISVDAEQKQFRGEWLGGLIADLERGDLMAQFTSGEFDRDIYAAMWNMGKNRDVSKLPPEAVEIAKVLEKYQTDARNTRNRFGAWIRDLNGYITRQSHDMFKIRDAGEQAFKDYVLPRLDMQRSLRDFEGSADDFLTRVYDDFAAGSHMKTQAGEVDVAAFGTGANLARRESQSRVLYFKDGNAAFEYNQKFGMGTLAQSVLQGLDHAAKSAGLLKVLGTNPEQTVTRLFDEYAETLRGDPARRAKFLSKRAELGNLLAQVDGSVNIPGNVEMARLAAFTRAWVAMAKLGGALISSVTDLANYAAEIRFGQDRSLLGGTLDAIGALTRGRAKGEQHDVLAALGVFHESTLGSVFARFDSPDLLGGKTAAAMQMFFKLNGLNWWTESLRDGYALTHANYLASNARSDWAGLPEALREMLSLYRIDAAKWELLRLAPLKMADGRAYMTPDGLVTIPAERLSAYITAQGRTVSTTSVQNLRDDLAGSLRAMTIDRMHHAVIEPGARTRAFMLRGTQPGTVTGELMRFIGQFKSFPVALVQMSLGREVYGRGYDTLGQYVRSLGTGKGAGDLTQLATFIALSTAMGYAAMAAKDLLRGKNPRPVDDPRTWTAAMVQGGGLGLYGDFLFGKYNRMGGSLTGTLAGPVAGALDTVADLWTRIRTGDDVAAVGFNAALANTPFMNLFYTRAVLDYLILYRIQEALNPGFLRRMERRVERETGQTFYLPPSRVVR
ncbi:hypothetical protein [Hydrogenophaga sp.]|uniref:hypothetical protein n=1 Tax=Hydrogenophaga sp. TaxID=1904254 RepID=UPI00272F02C0|nr:hypothetical protein [Hydrogenophaga sp.]MDP2073340.1 hypothetical protein [Hydrogenophaga sp.]MDP3348868.1 hypothetical protein [Hydrogenophaga sp.]